MNDEEFSNCMNVPFNSTEYRLKIPKSAHTGEKYMRKSVNIGDQCSQIIGIFYPTPVDNFVKIVKGQKFYGRYMDDSYVIHRDREFLVQLEIEIAEKAKELGMTLNRKKTRIVKLSDYYKFLQITYSLTDTGRVIRKINPKRIVDMRRKLKKLTTSTSTKLNSKTINVFFVDKTGNNIIAQFGSSPDGQIATFNTEVDVDPHSASAGSYSGQVYFSIMCE